MRLVVLLTALLGLTACASQPKNPSPADSDLFPKCERVNCTEPVAELRAPEGAVLSFEICNDGASRNYSYRRSGEAWVLTSYTMAAATCPSAQP